MTSEESVERKVKKIPLIPFATHHLVFAAGVLLGALSPKIGAAVAGAVFVGTVIGRIAFVEFARRLATDV